LGALVARLAVNVPTFEGDNVDPGQSSQIRATYRERFVYAATSVWCCACAGDPWRRRIRATRLLMVTNANKQAVQPSVSRPHAWLSGHPLARELVIVLIVKFMLLAGLWYAFFREAPVPEPSRLFAPVPAHHQEMPR
jgi:hypothetical protein